MKWVALLVAFGVGAHVLARPWLVCNEDNDRYFYSTEDAAFTEKGMVDYFDSIASGGAMTHYFMCVNGQRTSYDSKVWEPIWRGVDEPNSGGRTNDSWCVNAKKVHDRGLDPWAVWIRRAREKGVSPWISMRMNDTHFADRNPMFRNETFFYAHPELKCRPGRTDWSSMAWNYAEPAVRRHMMDLVLEILDRWDADGLELDWLRFTTHLPPGRERELAHVLTDFMRDVRHETDRAARRRGHPVKLAARVPTNPAAAAGLGLEPETWAKEGLVDLIVACNFYTTADFNWDFSACRARIQTANPSVVFLPGACNMVRLHPAGKGFQMDSDPAFFRAWAALYGRESNGLYLFNAFYHKRAVKDWFLAGALAPDRVAEGPRRFLCTWHDINPTGCDAETQLPRAASSGQSFRVRVAKGPSDREARVVLGYDRRTPGGAVFLNGVPALSSAEVDVRRIFFAPDVAHVVTWTFPVSALMDGENRVEAKGTPGSTAQTVWCEIAL